MFSSAVQPGIVSLFSSTGSDPLQLFSTHCDSTLHSGAYVGLLNDRPSHTKPRSSKNLVSDDESGFLLDQTVLHMQSPALPKTYIQCPSQPGKELGLKHSWIHIQARSLGTCDWSFEVGIADQLERKGIVRFSTFQKEPRLKLPAESNGILLLHLPLSFPSKSSRLTAWSTISLHLPTFLPHFTNTNLIEHESEPTEEDNSKPRVLSLATAPSGQYSHVSYVKIYSTCRLRRVWFSNGPSQKLPWEFELYAKE